VGMSAYFRGAAHSARRDLDEDLIGLNVRNRHVLEDESFAIFVHTCRFHVRVLSCVGARCSTFADAATYRIYLAPITRPGVDAGTKSCAFNRWRGTMTTRAPVRVGTLGLQRLVTVLRFAMPNIEQRSLP